MDHMAKAYEQLTARFVAWAESETNVRLAYAIGSRARDDHPADEWSDLDLIVLCEDPAPYIASTAWLEHVGTVWLSFVEPTPGGVDVERRVLFEGGLDVDFVLSSIARCRQALREGISPAEADPIRRGVRVLVDKENLGGQIAVAKGRPVARQPPDEAAYLNLVNDFWYHTVWTAKKLRRGELWIAKSCCDVYLKQMLLRMVEWHAGASKGWDTDTWMRGRFLEEWADGRAVDALPAIYARYEPGDVWRALLATMPLFRWLATETAGRLGYGYPSSGDEHATELVQALFLGRE